jgi:hypothetical protein
LRAAQKLLTSIVSIALVRPDSLAAERQAEALETAIVERRRLELLQHHSGGNRLRP